MPSPTTTRAAAAVGKPTELAMQRQQLQSLQSSMTIASNAGLATTIRFLCTTGEQVMTGTQSGIDHKIEPEPKL